MNRLIPTLLALSLLPLPGFAQEAGNGFQSLGFTLEGGGHPAGDYLGLRAETRATYALGWGEVGVDLALSSAEAGAQSLGAAGALVHLTARPTGWLALGPYLWVGSQSEGGTAHALGVEAAVLTGSGWGGELYFGETRGGVLGEEGYATNKGLRLSYAGQGRFSGYGELAKDTVNQPAGDQDFYRLAIGLDTWLDLPSAASPDRSVRLSLAVGQHHFDQLDERESWVSVGITIPLTPGGTPRPGFSSRRGVSHNLPLP